MAAIASGLLAALGGPEGILKGVGKGVSRLFEGIARGEDFGKSLAAGISEGVGGDVPTDFEVQQEKTDLSKLKEHELELLRKGDVGGLDLIRKHTGGSSLNVADLKKPRISDDSIINRALKKKIRDKRRREEKLARGIARKEQETLEDAEERIAREEEKRIRKEQARLFKEAQESLPESQARLLKRRPEKKLVVEKGRLTTQEIIDRKVKEDKKKVKEKLKARKKKQREKLEKAKKKKSKRRTVKTVI